MEKFINPGTLRISSVLPPIEKALSVILPQAVVSVPLGSLVDLDEEIKKLEKELLRLETEIRRSSTMLENENFLKKAPVAKIAEEQKKKTDYQENYRLTKERIEAIKK
jgi:valyl-tRNA synthetase